MGTGDEEGGVRRPAAARRGEPLAHRWCLHDHHSPQAFAGIVTVSVGHCHPAVNAAVIEQTGRLQHTTTIYLHNQVG